jgi:predicted RNA binding protein YcfA (HicA-like mRNA interferase family)
MSHWGSVKSKQLLAALLRIGWEVAWQKGSHRRLKRAGWSNYTFAFHDNEEVGPGLLA